MYLEGLPTSELSNAPTLVIIQHHNPFLFEKEANPPHWRPVLETVSLSWQKISNFSIFDDFLL